MATGKEPDSGFGRRKSKFYWYDFTVGGRRYRGSTKETNKTRTGALAALKLAQAAEGRDPLPRKAPGLLEFSGRFLDWVHDVRLERKQNSTTATAGDSWPRAR
jgi:hypothetical protein